MPKPSIFKKMQSPATASVVLILGRGTALAPHQIRGVQSLVAGSVEGLETPNVSVHDQNGVVLSENYGSEGAARSESQLAMKKEVDDYLSDKAQGMLAQVLGPNRAIVRVDATLNFERLEQQRKIYDPNQTVVRSEERNESSEGEGGSSEQSTTNYEINETLETVVGEIGNIKSMSVAVFVDGRYEAEEEGGDPAYTPLPEEELDQIARIVQTAVGLDVARGDRIEVVNMRFEDPVQVAEETGFSVGPFVQKLPENIGKFLLFGLLLLMALRLKNSLGEMMGQVYVPDGAPKPEMEAEKLDILETDASVVTLENKLTEVREFAGANPQEIADLVQAWVGESEGATGH
jgi:flagellar M-ring protein FliF